MNDIKIDQGATEDLLIECTDVVTAVLLVSEDQTSEPVITKAAPFVDGKAQMELVFADTNIEPGDYVYQIRLFDEDGQYFNLIRYECVTGDCTFSKFKVCPVLPYTPEAED